MGGPGLTAFSCIQYISEAADIVREIKREGSSTLDPELKAKIVDILDQLAEAKVAAVEASEEIRYISNHAEEREKELEYVTDLLVKAQPRAAPLLEEPDSPSSDDVDQAAQLVRLVTFAAADQGFRSLDIFASWFVGGTAAAIGLMVANFEKIEPFFASLDLQSALVKIVIALGLVGVAKFFGSLVTTLARGSERALEVLDAWKRRGQPHPSFAAFDAAREAALPLPFRLVPKKFRHRSYDATVQARQILTFLMIAGFCTLSAVTLVILVLADVAMAL